MFSVRAYRDWWSLLAAIPLERLVAYSACRRKLGALKATLQRSRPPDHAFFIFEFWKHGLAWKNDTEWNSFRYDYVNGGFSPGASYAYRSYMH